MSLPPLPKNPKKFWKAASILKWLKRERRVRSHAGMPNKDKEDS
jgi:hypothetical protein